MIEVQGLTKRFGSTLVLRAIDLLVPAGKICGFIGPNGAGKTTTMRILATLDVPTAGSVRIDGLDVVADAGKVRGRIGYMPDYYGTYADLVTREYLEFFGRAYRLPDRARRIAEVAEFTEIAPLFDRPVEGLSKGQKQRLSLARTLLSDPALLILDEPAAGLDPRARIELRELLRVLAEQGKTVFISSHILTELSDLIDWMVVIDRGRVRHCGPPGEVAGPDGVGLSRYHLELTSDPDAARRFLLSQPAVKAIDGDADLLLLSLDESVEAVDALVARMVGQGVRFRQLVRRQADLEDVFMQLTDRGSDAPSG